MCPSGWSWPASLARWCRRGGEPGSRRGPPRTAVCRAYVRPSSRARGNTAAYITVTTAEWSCGQTRCCCRGGAPALHLTGGRRCGSSIPPLELGPDCHVAAGSHEARARAANVEREERSPDAVVSSNASKLNICQSFSVLIVNCNSPTSPIIC